ncbi:MAG: EamA family transporter [Candidatus Omnitrophica bacterium]|nr:EamA family transporter [Candidatus Omnitrophota bacterium]MBU1923986.1 EamA family transporter [Candidatus Omnitrophota bacterium]
MFKKRVTLKILLLLLVSDILETAIHFFFKKGALSQAEFSVVDLPSAVIFLRAVFSSPFLWAGLLTVAVVFVIWSTILSKIDLSVAVPIASFSYILVPVVSVIFLHEQISALRWAGILLILIGVILVSLSSKERITQNK